MASLMIEWVVLRLSHASVFFLVGTKIGFTKQIWLIQISYWRFECYIMIINAILIFIILCRSISFQKFEEKWACMITDFFAGCQFINILHVQHIHLRVVIWIEFELLFIWFDNLYLTEFITFLIKLMNDLVDIFLTWITHLMGEAGFNWVN